jgi:hypothetical protein
MEDEDGNDNLRNNSSHCRADVATHIVTKTLLGRRELARKPVQARWAKEKARKPANNNTRKNCSEIGKKSDFLKTG